MKKFRQLDLNLLPVLCALNRHHNVTSAAKELNLSQSAVSHALNRLRDHFEDPLFVRVPKGMVPTPFFLEIQDRLSQFHFAWKNLDVDKSAFQPELAKGRVTVASTDYFESCFGNAFLKELKASAPGIQLSLRGLRGEFPKQELESGEYDLAISGYFNNVPQGFFKQILFKDTFCSMIHKDHSNVLKDGMSLEAFYQMNHALVTLTGDFRDLLKFQKDNQSYLCRYVYGSHFFTSIAWTLEKTDVILTAPRRLVEKFGTRFDFVPFECPVPTPELKVFMVWHGQKHEDPLQKLVREVIRKVCKL